MRPSFFQKQENKLESLMSSKYLSEILIQLKKQNKTRQTHRHQHQHLTANTQLQYRS